MNCKTCDYPLWNIEARQCPECGSPFKPSDFEFALNGVRFCCPGCRQAYYGTSLKGHLVPEEFDCVSCGKHVTMDEMVLLPTLGVSDHQTRGDAMPWLERSRIGWVKAWFATMGKAMSDPVRLIKLVPQERGGVEAILYALITLGLFTATSLGVFMLPGMISTALFASGSMSHGAGFAAGIAISLGLLIGGLAVLVLAQAGIAHLVMGVTGGTDQPFRRSLHCVAYSSGAAVLCAVPCLGAFLSPLLIIWWVVATGMMLREAHRTKAWRAVIATGLLPFLAICLIVASMVVSSMSSTGLPPRRAAAFGASGGNVKFKVGTDAPVVVTATPTPGPGQTVIAKVGQELLIWSGTNGEYPRHGVMLSSDAGLLLSDFVSTTNMPAATVSNTTLERLLAIDHDKFKSFAQEAAAALPKSTVAHRVGDIVFTYHGVKPADPAMSDLWIAALVTRTDDGESIWTVTASGASESWARGAEFDTALSAQNAAREKAGLGPLPDLRTVKDYSASLLGDK